MAPREFTSQKLLYMDDSSVADTVIVFEHDYPSHTAHLQHASFADRLRWRLLYFEVYHHTWQTISGRLKYLAYECVRARSTVHPTLHTSSESVFPPVGLFGAFLFLSPFPLPCPTGAPLSSASDTSCVRQQTKRTTFLCYFRG